jgi:O-antigen/teichoic acid export membrane protein
MLADRREKVLLTIGTLALVANVALNLVLLRRYNFTAAGFATAATELFYLIGAVVAFHIFTGRSALTWRTLLYVTPAASMAAILHLTAGGAVLRVCAGIGLGLLAVAAILVMPQSRQFRREMRSFTPTFGEAAVVAAPQVEL